jgi:hypothetical protein
MVIKCNSAKERNALRALLYRLREDYYYKVDRDVKDKMCIKLEDTGGEFIIRISPSTRSQISCFVDNDGELTPLVEGEDTAAISRLVSIMTADGRPQEEIDAAVVALRERGMTNG